MPISREFEDAFDSHSGGCSQRCDCGRLHFDTHNRWDWETGQLEKLEALAQTEPDKFIEIAGCKFVPECKCDGAARYERFIVSHASRIADFLNRRAEALKKEAEATTVTQP